MVDQLAYAHALAMIEAELPVERWRVDDLHIWPVFRVGALFAAIAHRASGAKRIQPWWQSAAIRIRSCLEPAALPVRPVDILLVGDGSSFVRSASGRWRDRVLEPLATMLDSSSLRSLLVQPVRRLCRTDRLTAWAGSGLAQAALLAPPASTVVLPAYERAAERIVAAVGHCPDAAWLVRQSVRILAMRRWWMRALEVWQPAAVVVVSYYGSVGWSLLAAARACGARSVDMQHGVQGACHPAYALCPRAPDRGYDIVPDACWVWSENEAAAMLGWSGGRPRPIVVGCPWIDAWLATQPASPAKTRARPRVLITLQEGLGDPTYLPLMRTLVDAVSVTCDLQVRAHPVTPSADIPRLTAILGHPVSDAATPLAPLLAWCDVHITHSSSSVLEAERLGVPSIVVSKLGATLYADAVHRGAACVVEDLRELPQRIRTLAERPRPGAEETADAARSRLQALRAQLLALAGAPI